MSLIKLFKHLKEKYPSKDRNHFLIVDDNDNLKLGIWVEDKPFCFYIDEDELNNIEQLLRDIENLISINKEG